VHQRWRQWPLKRFRSPVLAVDDAPCGICSGLLRPLLPMRTLCKHRVKIVTTKIVNSTPIVMRKNSSNISTFIAKLFAEVLATAAAFFHL